MRACWRLMRSSEVACNSSRPMITPAAGTRNTCTVGWAPVHTTTTPGTGAFGLDPSGMFSEYTLSAIPSDKPRIVTFDAGQTLVELDLDFLARRLGERGITVEVAALRAKLTPV